IVHVNDVETIAALNQIAGSTLGERECSLLKFWDSPSLPDPAQRAALLCAARIFGIFLGEVGEISTSFDLLQNVFSFSARGVERLGINFSVRTRERRLDQNMPHVHLLGHAVLLAML